MPDLTFLDSVISDALKTERGQKSEGRRYGADRI